MEGLKAFLVIAQQSVGDTTPVEAAPESFQKAVRGDGLHVQSPLHNPFPAGHCCVCSNVMCVLESAVCICWSCIVCT